MKTCNELAIELVQKFLIELDKEYAEPNWCWWAAELEYYSYSKSTLKDILELLENDKVTSPLTIVMEYRKILDSFACKNPNGSFIFSLGYDVTENVIDEFFKLGLGR